MHTPVNELPEGLRENTDPNNVFEKLDGATIECLGTKKCEMWMFNKKEFTTKDVVYWKVDLNPIVSRSFPSITQYINAITIPESFATKSTLRPVLKDDGTPYFSAGGYAVVFKMQCEESGKYYALKCFIREQTKRAESFQKISDYLNYLDSPYLVPYEYLENELWVEDADFPVLLMEWVEGETLDHRLAILCHQNNQQGIATLAETFDTLGLWLLEEELAHGDVKPDNIIIRPSGQPVLIDYDGMFVPSMIGEESREMGTQNWRHPKRAATDFNRHLDDFSILVISLSLQIFKEKPGFYHPTGNADNLLFTEADFLNPQASEAFRQVIALQSNKDIAARLSLLQYAVSLPVLQLIGLDLQLKRIASEVDDLQLTTTYDPSEGEYIDEYGVKYNAARTKLVKASYHLTLYRILPTTKVIIAYAFNNCDISSVKIPDSVTFIGDGAFQECKKLTAISIPNSVTLIGNGVFAFCHNLSIIVIPDSIRSFGHGVLSDCKKINIIINKAHPYLEWSDSVLYNKKERALLFYAPSKPDKTYSILPSTKVIVGGAFADCTNLISIIIPEGATTIEDHAFWCCYNLTTIIIPKSVTSIGDGAFHGCDKITKPIKDEIIKRFGEKVFWIVFK